MSRLRPRRARQWFVDTPDGGKLRVVTHGDPRAHGEHRVVVVCGAFLTATVYTIFAKALAAALPGGWAVDVYDRRGKGSSSRIPEDYSMATEISDVATVLKATGARNLFGHSVGGAVVLNAVQAFAGLDPRYSALKDEDLVPDATAVYDPAVNIDGDGGSLDTEWFDEFVESADRGRLGHALALVSEHLPVLPALSKAPHWMVAGVLALSVRTRIAKVGEDAYPAGVAELKATLFETDTAESFSRLPGRLRYVTGSRSERYFRTVSRLLSEARPGPSVLRVASGGVHGSPLLARPSVIAAVRGWLLG